MLLAPDDAAEGASFSSIDLVFNSVRLRRVCNESADTAAQQTKMQAMGLASLGTQLRLTSQTAREHVVADSASGEFSLRFQNFVHTLLLARIEANSDVGIKTRIQKQLVDFQVAWIQHRTFLLSRSGHGSKPSSAADAEAELQHLVLIAMDFHKDPLLLNQRARVGFCSYTARLPPSLQRRRAHQTHLPWFLLPFWFATSRSA